jgi:hypothetical protein
MNHYEILGLGRDASTEEIEQAFRTLARKVHPDLNAGDSSRAEIRMKQLNEIRETLSDPLLRSAYDAQLRQEEEAARRAAEAGPAGEYARVVQDPTWNRNWGGRNFVAPAGEGRRRGRLGAWTLLAGLVATVGMVGISFGRSHRFLDWLSGDRPPPLAPIMVAPVPPKEHAPERAPRAPAARPGTRGVVKIGSTAGEVLRILGPPERTERGVGPGNVILVYGKLRLELHNGAVVGGAM